MRERVKDRSEGRERRRKEKKRRKEGSIGRRRWRNGE